MKTVQLKISRAIVYGSLLIFIPIIFCGCETPEGTMAAGQLFSTDAAISNNPQQAAAWGLLGAITTTSAQWQHEKEVAEAGRSQINVNVNPSQGGLGVCGYWTPPNSAPGVISWLIVDSTGHTSVDGVRMNNGSVYSGRVRVLDGRSLVQPDGEGTMIFNNAKRLHGVFSNGIFISEIAESAKPDLKNAVIRVPTAEEMKAGAKIEVIIPEDLKTNEPVATSTLNNSSANGSVTVSADDSSFEVYSDGVFVGNAPAKLKLSEGSHVIEVKKAGFKDYKREIRVLPGSESNLKAVLEKE